MLVWVLIVLVILLLWNHLMKPFRYWKDLGVPQTNPWPVVGDAWPIILRLRSRRVEQVLWLYNKYSNKRYFGFYNFRKPNLLIRDPELIKQVGVKDFDHFTDHENQTPRDKSLLSKILFFMKGQEWKDARSTLSGAFTSSKIKYMFGTIKAVSEKFEKYFDDQDKDFIELEMKDTYTRFANDVIATAAFGLEVDSFKNPDNSFYMTGKTLFNSGGNSLAKLDFTFRLILPSSLYNFIREYLLPKPKLSGGKNPMEYFENVIYETIEAREKNNIKRNDMINLLLEIKHGVKQNEEKVSVDTGYATVKETDHAKSGKKSNVVEITNRFIAAQAILFFIAGFEPLSTSMSFGTYELALNPDVQKRLRKEIRETYEKCNGKVTYEAILHMKYLDMVVSEILRKWHPNGYMDRECTKPYTIPAENPGETDINLKPGDILYLPYIGFQRDPKYWPEPEKFDPERFSDENKDKIVPYTYLPFGVGPRNCIGSRFALLEMKCMFFHILRNFEFVRTEKTEVPLTLQKGSFQTTAENGFWLGLKRVP